MTNRQLLRILRRYPRSAVVLSNQAAPTIKLSQDQLGNWTIHIDPIDLVLKRMVISLDPEVGGKSMAVTPKTILEPNINNGVQEINDDNIYNKSNLEN